MTTETIHTQLPRKSTAEQLALYAVGDCAPQDRLDSAIDQAVAMSTIAAGEEFSTWNDTIQQSYLWALSHKLREVQAANQAACLEKRAENLHARPEYLREWDADNPFLSAELRQKAAS